MWVIRIGRDMKRRNRVLLCLVFIFLFSLNTFGQKIDDENISIVLSAKSLAKFVTRLLPYEIKDVNNFSGPIWIRSIKNVKIEKDKISLSSNIYGKDVIYNLEIGNYVSKIKLGNIDMLNDWDIYFRFDAEKKIFYITPHLKTQDVTQNTSYKEILINALFGVLINVEYPIDLKEINPVETDYSGNLLTIKFEVTDIYAADDKLTVLVRPNPHLQN